MTTYRIVQESLTNARKHAPDAPVSLEIDSRPDGVHVTVSNPLPAGSPVARSAGGGHGLLGMQERVCAFGGALTAGLDGDRFVVSAALPVHAPVAAR